ncbi:hypothetical protein QJS10_CPB18g00370 [Acorus calamus]|uniref:Uncharacterized protein n=1 Tax=Acorus calamus TaxID=4465 RepID=A0AAV9CLP7_ACOCL|nr:hypothetical protein QJS10_CPB18g00370 [Acorus calamus]
MSKKARRVSMEASPSYPVGGDEKMRIKIRELWEDCEVLEKETEAIRARLQREKQKKLNLIAEVRFLRGRYKYLLENPSHILPSAPLNQPKKSGIPFKSPAPRISSKHSTPQKNLPRNPIQKKPPRHSMQIPSSEAIHKRQVQKGVLKHYVQSHQSLESMQQIPLQRTMRHNPVLSVNHEIQGESILKEQRYTERGVGMMMPPGGIDLNHVSYPKPEDTGEFQVKWEPLRGEKKSKRPMIDEDSVSGDVSLSICRDVGGGSSRTGKRKISWQDQVALRV